MKTKWLSIIIVVLVVFVATFLAYMNSFDGPFVFDDLRNIRDNHQIRLHEFSWSSIAKASFGNPTPRPVAYVSFALNYYADANNVWGYHFVNTLIHALNGLLIFFLARALLNFKSNGPDDGPSRTKFCVALATALLFVLHPVQTQSVTYLVQRMTSLCATFYLLALLIWMYGRESGPVSRRIFAFSGVFVLWLLALGTKQLAVTLPIAILLIEWLFFQKGAWNFRYVYGFTGTALAVALVCYAFKGDEFFKLFTRGYSQREFTLVERLLTEGRVVIRYLSLLVWPAPDRLMLVYDFPLSRSFFQPVSTLVCWVAIGLSLGAAFCTAKSHPFFAFSVFWFYLHLVVESTVIPLEIIYEHRLYLPSFGFVFLFSMSVFRMVKHQNGSIALIVILGLVLGFWTHVRNQAWQSRTALWADNVQKAPDAARPLLGLAMQNAKVGEYQTSLDLLAKAVQSEPNFQELYIRRGQIYQALNQRDLALRELNFAISIPHEVRRGNAYGEAYATRGNLHRIEGRFDLAADDLEKALMFEPNRGPTYLARGDLNFVRGFSVQAVADYEKAVELQPDSVNAHKNLAWLLATTDDESLVNARSAIVHAAASCDLTEWKDHSAISTLAAAYARAGEFSTALEFQRKAIDEAPLASRAFLQARLNLFAEQKAIIISRKPASK